MVTPSSSNLLSTGRKSRSPLHSTTASPSRGAGATSNSAARPEQPPGVTVKRKPLSGPAEKRSMRRMNFSAAGVMVTFICLLLRLGLVPRIVRVDDAGAVDGANRHALRVVVEADALGTLCRINHKAGALLGDCIVGTFRLTCRAGGAAICHDQVCHFSSSLIDRR